MLILFSLAVWLNACTDKCDDRATYVETKAKVLSQIYDNNAEDNIKKLPPGLPN